MGLEGRWLPVWADFYEVMERKRDWIGLYDRINIETPLRYFLIEI